MRSREGAYVVAWGLGTRYLPAGTRSCAEGRNVGSVAASKMGRGARRKSEAEGHTHGRCGGRATWHTCPRHDSVCASRSGGRGRNLWKAHTIVQEEQAAASVRCMLLCTSIACACTNYNTGFVRMRDHEHYTLAIRFLWHNFGMCRRARINFMRYVRYALLAGTYFVFEVCEYSFLS